jgi:hypothetical protein
MVIQLLGVALISLLTITPTIQQNNIEQLNAPNIDILTNGFINPSPQRIYEEDNYSYYWNLGSGTLTIIRSDDLYINYTGVFDENSDEVTINRTFTTSSTSELILINNNNFYIYDQQSSSSSNTANISRTAMMNLIKTYYQKLNNTSVTSETFSWTTSSTALAATVDFYTYSVTGNAGTISGNVYVRNLTTFGQTSLGVTNNTVTITNSSVEALVQAVNPLVSQLELASTGDHKIWYYFTSEDLATTNGTYTTTLRARTNYGRVVSLGEISYTLSLDTTPPVIQGPTTLSFEIGTYSLIEQILNTFYTITDEPNDDWDWNIIGSYNLSQVGTYNISIRAFDTSNNETIYPITINVTAPPTNDTTPPVITGPSTLTFGVGTINNDGQLLAQFTFEDDITLPSAITKQVIGAKDYIQPGTYPLTIRATDQANNIMNKSITLILTVPDTTPPVINGPLLITFDIGTYSTVQEILELFEISDNIAISTSNIIGNINFNQLGEYPIVVTATDINNNTTQRNSTVRIREEIILGNYNPLSDLLSGIFGAGLSMIFTLGTINVLGFRVLDGMGIIILGFVIFMIYKALRGGN